MKNKSNYSLLSCLNESESLLVNRWRRVTSDPMKKQKNAKHANRLEQLFRHFIQWFWWSVTFGVYLYQYTFLISYNNEYSEISDGIRDVFVCEMQCKAARVFDYQHSIKKWTSAPSIECEIALSKKHFYYVPQSRN